MISVTVDNSITITGLSAEIRRSVIRKFSIPNKAYFVALEAGRYTKNIPQTIPYVFETESGDLVLPRGMGAYVKKLLEYLGESKAVWNKRTVLQGATFTSSIDLRPYQVPIVNAVIEKLDTPLARETSGLIEMGTGTGKTAVALAIAAKLGMTTTILVPNLTLLNQWAEDIRRWYGIEPGQCGGDILSIGDIIIATWQLAGKIEALHHNTSLLIIDECNGVTSPVRRKTLAKFCPSFIIGLTATPDRSDGQGLGVQYILGQTLAQYEKTELKPEVDIIRSEVYLPIVKDKRNAIDYAATVDGMVENKSRNTLIVGLLVGELLLGRKVLVLTKRIAHYQKIMELMPESWQGIYTIDSADESRHTMLKSFKDGSAGFRAILGTTSLLAVGMDIPALDTIILACDIRSDVLTTQSVGRILRIFEGKQSPKIIDITDGSYWDPDKEELIVTNHAFYNQARARKALYIKKGWLAPSTFKKKTTNLYAAKKEKYHHTQGRLG